MRPWPHYKNQHIIMTKAHYQAFGIAGVLLLAVLVLFVAVKAHANPSEIVARARTAVATTTLSYMTAGNATTTLTFDANNVASDNPTNTNSSPYKADNAQLYVRFTASTTLTQLCRRTFYSNDNVDYYATQTVVTSATSSVATQLYGETCFSFASTSEAIFGSNTTNNRTETITTPARFTKVQFYTKGANGAVYAEIAPSREVK